MIGIDTRLLSLHIRLRSYSIEDILKRDSAASGIWSRMHYELIEVIGRKKEEREARRKAEETTVSADSDFSGLFYLMKKKFYSGIHRTQGRYRC